MPIIYTSKAEAKKGLAYYAKQGKKYKITKSRVRSGEWHGFYQLDFVRSGPIRKIYRASDGSLRTYGKEKHARRGRNLGTRIGDSDKRRQKRKTRKGRIAAKKEEAKYKMFGIRLG